MTLAFHKTQPNAVETGRTESQNELLSCNVLGLYKQRGFVQAALELLPTAWCLVRLATYRNGSGPGTK